MGGAVQEHVDAGGVGNDGLGGPLGRDALITQMAHRHHIVRAPGPGLVHCGLDAVIQLLSVSSLPEAVHRLPGLVPEVSGVGLGQALRGTDPHIAYGGVPVVQESIGLEHRFARRQAGEVAAEIGELRPGRQLHQPVHPIVELVVARHRQVIARRVHQGDDVLPLGEGAHRLALDGISRVHQGHPVRPVLLLQRPGIGRQAGIADGVVQGTVDVVGVENHDLLSRLRRLGGGGQGDRQQQRRCQRRPSVHLFHVSSSFPFSYFPP